MQTVGATTLAAAELGEQKQAELEAQKNQEIDLQNLHFEDIDRINDPEQLKGLLKKLLEKTDELESRVGAIAEKTENQNREALETKILPEKLQRLAEVRFGLTDVTERMTVPYVVSPALQGARTALEILAEQGKMNAIILEGEPGTGKTQFTYSEVGQELQDGKDVALVHVRVKDTMRSQDLLYTVDNVRRLSDAQATPLPEKIRDEAAEWKKKILEGEVDPIEDGAYLKFARRLDAVTKMNESSKDLSYEKYIDLGPMGEAIVQSALGKKVYLLIDEIEKGREELMTGMLDELENLNFTIAETGDTIRGDKKNLRVVVTTNSEGADKIPGAFRRRCLYQYLEYPDRDEMEKIVELNYPDLNKKLEKYALDIFEQIRGMDSLEKKPSTPELLSWIAVLQAENQKDEATDQGDKVDNSDGDNYLNVLLKYPDDVEQAEAMLDDRRERQKALEKMTSEAEVNPDGPLAEEAGYFLQVETDGSKKNYERKSIFRDDCGASYYLESRDDWEAGTREELLRTADAAGVSAKALAWVIDEMRDGRKTQLCNLAEKMLDSVLSGENDELRKLVRLDDVKDGSYEDGDSLRIDAGLQEKLMEEYGVDMQTVRDAILVMRKQQWRAHGRCRRLNEEDINRGYTLIDTTEPGGDVWDDKDREKAKVRVPYPKAVLVDDANAVLDDDEYDDDDGDDDYGYDDEY